LARKYTNKPFAVKLEKVLVVVLVVLPLCVVVVVVVVLHVRVVGLVSINIVC
jgi:hypothetical protein